jgi:hypothetical protein
MIAILQNQNDEMRKHIERMENGLGLRKKKAAARRDGLRSTEPCIRDSGRRLFGTPTINNAAVRPNVRFFDNNES